VSIAELWLKNPRTVLGERVGFEERVKLYYAIKVEISSEDGPRRRDPAPGYCMFLYVALFKAKIESFAFDIICFFIDRR
jgi:hypothetical protein